MKTTMLLASMKSDLAHIPQGQFGPLTVHGYASMVPDGEIWKPQFSWRVWMMVLVFMVFVVKIAFIGVDAGPRRTCGRFFRKFSGPERHPNAGPSWAAVSTVNPTTIWMSPSPQPQPTKIMKPTLKNETRSLKPSTALSSFSKFRTSSIHLGLICCIAAACTASAGVHRLNTDEMKLFRLAANDHGQKRGKVTLDPILCKVARERASDMARKNYFNHVNLNGQGPNHLIRRAGYGLPSFYDKSRSGNNIESIAMTTGDSKSAFTLWMNSDGHRPHLLGEQAFYKEQTSVGVGVFRSPNPPYYKHYVFLSAPANESTLPPLLILKDPKGKILARTSAGATDLINPVINPSRE
jgi:uncharacterized protein YkwD